MAAWIEGRRGNNRAMILMWLYSGLDCVAFSPGTHAFSRLCVLRGHFNDVFLKGKPTIFADPR